MKKALKNSPFAASEKSNLETLNWGSQLIPCKTQKQFYLSLILVLQLRKSKAFFGDITCNVYLNSDLKVFREFF